MLKTNDFNGDGYRTFIEQFPGQKMKTFSFVPIISEKIASNETLTLSRRRPLSYRDQFLYDNGLHLERDKVGNIG